MAAKPADLRWCSPWADPGLGERCLEAEPVLAIGPDPQPKGQLCPRSLRAQHGPSRACCAPSCARESLMLAQGASGRKKRLVPQPTSPASWTHLQL